MLIINTDEVALEKKHGVCGASGASSTTSSHTAAISPGAAFGSSREFIVSGKKQKKKIQKK
jgi:hypothetical protein